MWDVRRKLGAMGRGTLRFNGVAGGSSDRGFLRAAPPGFNGSFGGARPGRGSAHGGWGRPQAGRDPLDVAVPGSNGKLGNEGKTPGTSRFPRV